MKPGASIVIHPIFPGRLKREVVEVFPDGYQGVIHWTTVTFLIQYGEDLCDEHHTRGNQLNIVVRRLQCSFDGGSQPSITAIAVAPDH